MHRAPSACCARRMRCWGCSATRHGWSGSSRCARRVIRLRVARSRSRRGCSGRSYRRAPPTSTVTRPRTSRRGHSRWRDHLLCAFRLSTSVYPPRFRCWEYQCDGYKRVHRTDLVHGCSDAAVALSLHLVVLFLVTNWLFASHIFSLFLKGICPSHFKPCLVGRVVSDPGVSLVQHHYSKFSFRPNLESNNSFRIGADSLLRGRRLEPQT